MVVISNCKGWMNSFVGPHELVDGLQRITAVRKFMANEIPAFGVFRRDYTGHLGVRPSFRWQVTTIPTKAEVLKVYLMLNSGGTVHSPEAIEKVKRLLETEIDKNTNSVTRRNVT